MNPANKLTLSVLSLIMVSGLSACNNSSNHDQIESTIPMATEEVQEANKEAEISLERIKEEVLSEEKSNEKAESILRQYTITDGDSKIVVSFKNGKEKYGNKNTKIGDIEYVINDMCADENCSQIVSVISKIADRKIKQDSYLYKIDSEKYSLVCKEENTQFEQQEDALDYLQSSENCKIVEAK